MIGPYLPGGGHLSRAAQQALLVRQQALHTRLRAWLAAQGARLATWDPPEAWTPGLYVMPSAFAVADALLVIRYVPVAAAGTARAVWGADRDRTQDAVMSAALARVADVLTAAGWGVERYADEPGETFAPALYITGAPP